MIISTSCEVHVLGKVFKHWYTYTREVLARRAYRPRDLGEVSLSVTDAPTCSVGDGYIPGFSHRGYLPTYLT